MANLIILYFSIRLLIVDCGSIICKKSNPLTSCIYLCLFVIKMKNILFGINPDDKIDENMSEFYYGTMIEQC